MIKIKKLIKISTVILSIFSIVIFSLIIYGNTVLPDTARAIGKDLNFSGIYTVNASDAFAVTDTKNSDTSDSPKQSSIKLFGTIPVKSINIKKTERKYIIPGGELIGIRLKTDGVLVVGTENFVSNGNNVSPAESAGIKVGDSLLSINGKKITTNKELAELIAYSQGNIINVKIRRDSEDLEITLKPELSDISGTYKSGLWIRDSTGGIGTLTYIDIENGTFASLGHGIYDTDTNKLLPTDSGELFSAALTGIKKGTSGIAGELKGTIGGDAYANIQINCENGVFGNIVYIDNTSEMIPVATANEVKTGQAQIISTVDGNRKEFYDIEIEKINQNTENKNMIIKVTDKKLLEKTGGIIQGMSGSPIIQDGMFIGAVTHVFLNDPTKGYAILAENMLAYTESAAEENPQNAA